MGEFGGDGFSGSIGGNCPVRGDGIVDGHAWYFRARGNHWALHIAAIGHGEDVVGAGEDAPGWIVWEPWGENRLDAGWMSVDIAWEMIGKAIAQWRNGQAKYFSGKQKCVAITDEKIEELATRAQRAFPGGSPDALREQIRQALSVRETARVSPYGDGIPEEQALSEIANARRHRNAST